MNKVGIGIMVGMMTISSLAFSAKKDSREFWQENKDELNSLYKGQFNVGFSTAERNFNSTCSSLVGWTGTFDNCTVNKVSNNKCGGEDLDRLTVSIRRENPLHLFEAEYYSSSNPKFCMKFVHRFLGKMNNASYSFSENGDDDVEVWQNSRFTATVVSNDDRCQANVVVVVQNNL